MEPLRKEAHKTREEGLDWREKRWACTWQALLATEEIKNRQKPYATGARRSSSHRSVLRYGHGSEQGPQGDRDCECAKAEPLPRAPHQAHKIHARRNLRGVWLCPIQAVCHGAAQGLQGQVHPQVHQEEGGDTHLCQEEERGAGQRPAAVRKAAATKD